MLHVNARAQVSIDRLRCIHKSTSLLPDSIGHARCFHPIYVGFANRQSVWRNKGLPIHTHQLPCVITIIYLTYKLTLADHGPAAQRDLADVLPPGVQAQLAQLFRCIILVFVHVGHVPEAAAGADAGGHQPRQHGRVGTGGALRNHLHTPLR